MLRLLIAITLVQLPTAMAYRIPSAGITLNLERNTNSQPSFFLGAPTTAAALSIEQNLLPNLTPAGPVDNATLTAHWGAKYVVGGGTQLDYLAVTANDLAAFQAEGYRSMIGAGLLCLSLNFLVDGTVDPPGYMLTRPSLPRPNNPLPTQQPMNVRGINGPQTIVLSASSIEAYLARRYNGVGMHDPFA